MGGATSGYWAIDRDEYATPPPTSTTTDSTPAKIGRSMKKFESVKGVGPGGVAGPPAWPGPRA